ncbi:MAG: ribonuclease HII [Candidatus Aenigmarchaeota archaeon]|nr:ribonuclease HII [Candidatus Aenigmarchaeota archaeon]
MNLTNILGIDEAGRGPVLGPLVICGYLIDEKNMPALKKTGVKDSKLLTREQRKKMLPGLKKIASGVRIIQVPASEIDSSDNLNKLEIRKMQEIINSMQAERVYIDAPERNTKKFAGKIRHGLVSKGVEITAENFADRKYPEVSAASVIAKVTRDAEIKKLHRVYGNFGSGYTSDERTTGFLKDWIKMNKEFPKIVRKRWITAEEILREKQQKNLHLFAE